MAIRDLLSASAGFRRNQWTGRNPNSSPLFNQFSPRQQERPPGTMARKAMGLGWLGYNEQGDHSENSRAAIAWLKQNHPSGLQRLFSGIGAGLKGAVEGYKGSINPEGLTIGQRRAAVTGQQPPTKGLIREVIPGYHQNGVRGTLVIMRDPGVDDYTSGIVSRTFTPRTSQTQLGPVGTQTPLNPYPNSLFDETPIELQGIPPAAPPIEQPETQQTVTVPTTTTVPTTPSVAGGETIRGGSLAALLRRLQKEGGTTARRAIGGGGLGSRSTPGQFDIARMSPEVAAMTQEYTEGLTPEAEAPLSFWQKVGGFFKKPEVSRGMMAMGGSMLASDSPYFGQSVGEGLRAGQEAAGLAREEEERLRQEGRLDTELAQRTELYNRQITAEDLSIKRAEERRNAYENIFPDDKFDQAAFADAMKIATKHGDVGFAGQLINMYPKDLKPEYQIGTLYDPDEGYNVDYLYEISPDGKLDKTRIGRSEWKPTAAGAGQSQLNSQLGNLGISAGMEMVKGDRPYNMAGWVRGPQGEWVEGGPAQQFQSYVAGVIGRGQGAEAAGWWNSMREGVVRKGLEGSPFGESVLAGHVAAIEMINPVVRYLSGAQMTNKEAMRYYGSLVPTWGDPTDVVQQKIRYMNAMFAAMDGDPEALAALGARIEDFAEFVPDPTKSEAQNKADGIARGQRSQQMLENAMATRELGDEWDNPSASSYMDRQVGSSLNIIR